MAELHKVDAVPGNEIDVSAQQRAGSTVALHGGGSTVEVTSSVAHAVLVRPR